MLPLDERSRVSREVLAYVFRETAVQPWVIVHGKRKAYIVEARATAAILMRLAGMSYGQVAGEIGQLSASSAYELIETWTSVRSVQRMVDAYRREYPDRISPKEMTA